jgi:hypothetical protein
MILNNWTHDYSHTSRELGISKRASNLRSGGDEFKFQPGMTILMYFMVFLHHPKQMPGQYTEIYLNSASPILSQPLKLNFHLMH